jgi:hypothetical protein
MRKNLIILALLLALAPQATAQGVHVALTPAYSVVSTGATFEVDLTCTQSGSPFNTYDVTVGWDPAAVTFQPTSPLSLQIGSLMTGACANSPTQFYTPSTDHIDATVSLLCNGVSLTGPGQLYRLHFKAGSTPKLTGIHIRHIQFYNAGVAVGALDTTFAEVNIGNVTGVDPAPGARPLALHAAPTPFRGSTTFRLESPVAGPQSLVIYDVVGRPVRHLAQAVAPAGSRQVGWDGRDDSGSRLASGIYVARLSAGGRTATVRLALLR